VTARRPSPAAAAPGDQQLAKSIAKLCAKQTVDDRSVVKDLRLTDEDKDEDLKIGPRGFSRTRTFLEDNNTVNTGSQINARVF